MTVEVKHATQAAGVDAGNGEIHKTQWNEAHTITMSYRGLLGRVEYSSGPVVEITLGDNLTISGGALTCTAIPTYGGTAYGLTINSYTEIVFAVTGTAPALSPLNGTIQTWALTGSSTPTALGFSDGQSMTLMIDDGSAYTINWTSMSITWKTDSGSAPTLNTAGYTVIELWKVGGVLYGARVGNA